MDIDGNIAHKITVNAKVVVISSGAIASSHLLLKNSIAQDRAGIGLALHPAPFALGDFPFEVKGNQGIPMAYTLHEFGVTNGVEDGGFLIEGIYLPPLLLSMPLSIAGPMHGDLMERYEHYAMAGLLVRDNINPNGKITITDLGQPRVSYSLGKEEVEDVAKGMEIVARMWFRLGATRVVVPHRDKTIIRSEGEIPELVNAIKNNPQDLLLDSAHPQGGNRMGNDPTKCVVDSNCKVYGFKNLFVCDASVFPIPVGVNPQLTIMSLATIIANRINGRWNDFASTQLKERLGEICSIRQPMYCPTTSLDQMYEISDSALTNDALVNSKSMDIVDGENWSFDPTTLTIYNNRYWKGFFPNDHDQLSTVELYAGGFYKRFQKEHNSVNGITHPYMTDINAKNEAINADYPGFGKLIYLKYSETPYNKFYDFLKFVDKDTILGKAFAVRDPPRGEPIITFSMSRRYTVDFMTQDDFKMIFSKKARKPRTDEVLGVWEGRLISDSALSPVLFRFRYYKDNQELKCKYIFGGFLPGTSNVRFSEEQMLMFDFTGGLLRDEIMMVRKDCMLGKYCTMDSPVFKILGSSRGFSMQDGGRQCLPYILKRMW